MKTYHEALQDVAQDLGEQAYHNIMGGSMNFPFYNVPVEGAAKVLATVFDEDAEEVQEELYKLAQLCYDAHWPKQEEA